MLNNFYGIEAGGGIMSVGGTVIKPLTIRLLLLQQQTVEVFRKHFSGYEA